MSKKLERVDIAGLNNTPDFGDLLFAGKPLDDKVRDKVVGASVDMGTTRITEIAFTIDDPEFKLLDQKTFTLKTNVTYRGLLLQVAVIETGAGAGLGGFTVRCRPKAVHKLKDLRGEHVMRNITPELYLRAECKKAGIERLPVSQKSKERKRIKRDVKQDGVEYDPSNIPSAWTTLQRLAGEEGFLFYEIGGVIFFGKPTWLVDQQPKVQLEWYPENDREPFSIPEFRETVDSKDIELTSLKLPLKRAGDVFPGMGLKVTGFPRYSDLYFINSVSYPLVGKGELTISAGKVINPTPQPRATSSSTATWDGEIVGDWVPNADKVGMNCVRTPRQMVAAAHAALGTRADLDGLCQKWVNMIAKNNNYGGGASSGVAEWGFMPAGTPHGTETNAPAGSVVCYSHPHTAIAIGDGKMIGTSSSGIAIANIAGYTDGYLGWKYPNLHP